MVDVFGPRCSFPKGGEADGQPCVVLRCVALDGYVTKPGV